MKVPAMITLLTLMICSAVLQAQDPVMLSSGGARGEDPHEVSSTTPTPGVALRDNAGCRVSNNFEAYLAKSTPKYATTTFRAADMAEAKAHCTDAIFAILMQQYPDREKSVEWEVILLGDSGEVVASSCPTSGCGTHTFHNSMCVVHDDHTQIPDINAEYFEKGYVFRLFTATSLTDAQSKCTEGVFHELTYEYTGLHYNGRWTGTQYTGAWKETGMAVKWQVVFYDKDGRSTTDCASSGCADHPIDNAMCLILPTGASYPQFSSVDPRGPYYSFKTFRAASMADALNQCTRPVFIRLMDEAYEGSWIGRENRQWWVDYRGPNGQDTPNKQCATGGCEDKTPSRGMCLVTREGISGPHMSSPQVGEGYAFKLFPAASLADAEAACTRAEFERLMRHFDRGNVIWMYSFCDTNNLCSAGWVPSTGARHQVTH